MVLNFLRPFTNSAVLPSFDEDVSRDWLKRLGRELDARRFTLARYEDYYTGQQGRRLVNPSKYPPNFAKVFMSFAMNFMEPVVRAVEERLDIEGFRFPTVDSAPDSVDPDAWTIWQDNQLDSLSLIGHTEALVKGIAYVLVSPFEQERVASGSPLITVESPDDVIVRLAPGGRRRIIGMKRWRDDEAKRTYAVLYYPDRIEKWQTSEDDGNLQLPVSNANVRPPDDTWYSFGGGTERPIPPSSLAEANRTWERWEVPGETWPLPNELGVVPVVPLVNRPRLDGTGESEIRQVMSLQDAINTLAMNELVTSESAAIPQKWATGIEVPKDPETGADVKDFKPDLDRIISTATPDAKFGQFASADLGQFGVEIDRYIERIAAISGTPFARFQQHSGQPPSGDSIKGSEQGLNAKAERKQRHFGESWEEVMRLAFRALKDPRGFVTDAETKWRPSMEGSESEHVDAVTKKRAAKVPLKQLWEDLYYTPGQIAKFPQMLKDEAAMLVGTLVEPIAPDNAAVQKQIQERVSP